MSRAKRSVPSRRYRKKIIAQASGFRGRANRCSTLALQAVQNSLLYNYRDRKNRKRELRALWIIRINAAARLYGMTYSVFMHKLLKSDLVMNRKMLADIAVNNPILFSNIVKKVASSS